MDDVAYAAFSSRPESTNLSINGPSFKIYLLDPINPHLYPGVHSVETVRYTSNSRKHVYNKNGQT